MSSSQIISDGRAAPPSYLQPSNGHIRGRKKSAWETIMQKKTEFIITLRDDKASFYCTHDLIQGHVSLKFEEDTVVDGLSITLEGKAIIRVEKHVNLSNAAGYVFGNHTFLRMSQHIESTILPENHLARRGKCYVIPFNFTVPETLLPYACSDGTVNENVVRKAHLLLPPSLGRFKTAGILVDDLGPNTAKVSYNVHARVRKFFYDDTSVLLEEAQPVRIIPMREEDPPLPIKENDAYYTLAQEKNVYRGTSTIGKLVGRLVAETTQLPSLKLPHPRAEAGDPPTLTPTVSLRFDPASEGEPPPQLRSIKSKLRSFTFLGVAPYKMIPRPGDCHEDSAKHTHYVNTTRLASRNLGAVVWVRHGPCTIAATSEPSEHASSSEVACTSRTPSPSSPYEDHLPFYTTSLQIPIRLPQYTSKQSKQKLFVPTFSSCIISRAYSLELNLSYKGASATSDSSTNIITASTSISRYLTPRSHFLLRIPLQITVRTERPSSPLALTLQSRELHHQGDEQVEDLTSELAQQFSAYSQNADPESRQSGADQRSMLSETMRLSVALSNPGTAPLPRRVVYGALGNVAVEERPPAYLPEFQPG